MKTIDFASFNTAGNLRGFTSAPEKEAKKHILTDMKEGLLILPLKNLSVIPERMLNMMYIKTSKNNDLAEILKIINPTKVSDEELAEKENEILEYFEEYDVNIDDSPFSLADMARELSVNIDALEKFLFNLEDTQVMQDIANGDYGSFDMDDSEQFNDAWPFNY